MLRIFVLALSLGVVPGWADEASRAAKVEEYFRLSKLEQTYAQTMTIVMNQVWMAMAQQMQAVKIPPGSQADIEVFKMKLGDVVAQGMGWEAMKPSYVKLYAEAFSDEELDAMVAFYSSAAGQSMVAKTPELMTRSSAMAQKRMAEVQPAIQAVVREFMEKMTAPPAEPATP